MIDKVGNKWIKPVIGKVGNHGVFFTQNKISHSLALLKTFEEIIKSLDNQHLCKRICKKGQNSLFLSHLLWKSLFSMKSFEAWQRSSTFPLNIQTRLFLRQLLPLLIFLRDFYPMLDVGGKTCWVEKVKGFTPFVPKVPEGVIMMREWWCNV